MPFDAEQPSTADAIRAAFLAARFPEPDAANVAEMARRVAASGEPLASVVERSVNQCACYFERGPWAQFCGDLQLALGGYVRQEPAPLSPVNMGSFGAQLAAAAAREVRS